MASSTLTVSAFQQLARTNPSGARAELLRLQKENPQQAAEFERAVDWTALQGGQPAHAARPTGDVNYENRVADAPKFRGTVEVHDGQVELLTANGTRYQVASNPEAPWNLRWGAEVGSFAGQEVTVHGLVSDNGKVLMVQEFVPGSGDGVQGRILLKGDEVFVNVRPDKQVKVMNAGLAQKLKKWERVNFIFSGKAEYDEKAKQWRYSGGEDSVYLLTKLNPGEGVYYADTPFERVHMKAAPALGGVLPNERMGYRIFVHGKIVDAPVDAAVPNRRFFEADWVGTIIPPEWVDKSNDLGSANAFAPVAAVEEPATSTPTFAPRMSPVLRGSKTGHVVRSGPLPIEERWFEGRKLAEGPIDAQGRPHGQWSEFSAVPLSGEVNAQGEAPFRYVETLRGEYQHGLRTGLWTQIIDGQPTNAWQWEQGKLKANGHLDAQGRPNAEWTLVADDGFRDGGEGIYSHGKAVSRWNWYKPGTTEYLRTELYHPNGQLAAKGEQRTVRGADGVDRTYRLGAWEFYDVSGQALGRLTYSPEQQVDVEQQGPLGNGANWSWIKAPPAD